MIIEITRAHADRARGFEARYKEGRACWCPVAIAICEATGLDPQENVNAYFIDSATTPVVVGNTTIDVALKGGAIRSWIPPEVRRVLNWFDEIGLFRSEPEWPVRLALGEPM